MNIQLAVTIVKDFGYPFLGIASRPVKYEKFVFLIKPFILLNLFLFYKLKYFLSFDGARIVIRHGQAFNNETINNKRLTIRAAKPYNDYRKTEYSSRLNEILLVGFILILSIVACGHKASPLAKDRLKPRLQTVQSLNNRQVEFTFSEMIDTLSLLSENFTITSNGDTLKILTVYSSFSTSEIIAVTGMQSQTMYEVSGYVFDAAENRGKFKSTFMGSTEHDTIAPWLVGYSQGENNKDFVLTFSEAMDTAFMNFHIIPRKNFIASWQNYRVCSFIPYTPVDSLGYDTTYYLYIEKGARDLNGNSLELFITYVTPDTIYEPLILQGMVLVDDTLVKAGMAILKREIALGITQVEDGEFAFEVRDSLPYLVEVVSGSFSGTGELSIARQDSIFLKREEQSIDDILD